VRQGLEAGMNVTSAVERFAALSVRQGVSLGILHSSRPADFALLLAVAARSFSPARTYTEPEVNALLRGWLEREGAMLALDHVELRRWLVDCRVLARDDYGRAYAPGEPCAEIAELANALSGVDLAAVAARARSRDAKAREERRRSWNQRRKDENQGPGHEGAGP
jgi:hypothetical protein